MTTERELPDDYPIYPGYLYVINGEVIRSYLPNQTTVGEMKKVFKTVKPITSFTNCDIKARNLWDQMI